jgi:hypothetical protein
MAVVVIRGTARAAWLTGLTGLRARAWGMAQRATGYVAAAVMVCAVGAALLQLAAEILSFSAPIAVTGITVMTAALLNLLRRRVSDQKTSARTACRSARMGRSPATGGSPYIRAKLPQQK